MHSIICLISLWAHGFGGAFVLCSWGRAVLWAPCAAAVAAAAGESFARRKAGPVTEVWLTWDSSEPASRICAKPCRTGTSADVMRLVARAKSSCCRANIFTDLKLDRGALQLRQPLAQRPHQRGGGGAAWLPRSSSLQIRFS